MLHVLEALAAVERANVTADAAWEVLSSVREAEWMEIRLLNPTYPHFMLVISERVDSYTKTSLLVSVWTPLMLKSIAPLEVTDSSRMLVLAREFCARAKLVPIPPPAGNQPNPMCGMLTQWGLHQVVPPTSLPLAKALAAMFTLVAADATTLGLCHTTPPTPTWPP